MNVDQNLERIALACVVECERQHVGLDRLASLLVGYAYAVDNADRLPSEADMLHLAGMVEPDNAGRYRKTPVTFASGFQAATHEMVPGATARLFALLDQDTDADEFTKAFLSIHPLTDGNGRTAFVLYNWIRGSLDSPHGLPEFS